jgi:phage I-like protein
MPATALSAPSDPSPSARITGGVGLAVAAPQTAEPAAAPDWVHLLPAGTVSGRDGRGPYTVDVAAVLAAFAAHGGELPVDYEHQSLDAALKSGPVPAAGWIEAIEARADGIWGRVRWTERAAALLAAREYRYLSPVFRYEPASGRVLALEGAALTHTPNLAELTAAASATRPPDLTTPEAHAMTPADAEILERVCHHLSLPGQASVEDLLDHLQRLMERLAAAEETVALAAQATQAAPDPAAWVPAATHAELAARCTELEARLAAAETAEAEASAQQAVTAAQAAGRLTPALLPWALAYARQDPEGFAAFVAHAPALTPPAGATEPAAAAAADPEAIARAAQAHQAERERAGLRLSFAEAVAQVLRGQAHPTP